ncbi:MAG: DUF5317 domain-containing protein [Desulfocucumaceae bacterium]
MLLALLIGLARGGKWQNITTFKFKKSWLVILAMVLQLAIFNPLWDKYVDAGLINNYLYVLSVVILVIFLLVNIDISGLRILGLGIVSNGVAIVANGGHMPSSLEALKKILPQETISQLQNGSAAYNVVLITDETKFSFLCDLFYIPNINVYSVGDILIALGAFITVQQIMLHRKVLML